jgi:hypothetical protein
VTLFNFIITAYGIHPSCGHACLQRGTYTDKHQIKDQVAPEYLWGLIHQGTRPRINPCPRHGYPGPCPGVLAISRDFNCLVPDQEPQSCTGGPLRVFTVWSQTKNPSHVLGALSGVFTTWSQTKNPSHVLGALSGVFTAWSQTRNPSHVLGALSGVFTAWSQTKNPSHLLGALTRVFSCGTDSLVPDQVPQECTGGPRTWLGS